MENKLLLYLFCKLTLVTVVLCSKLNVPRVLLPAFNEFSSTFVLEATEGGCYKWSATRLDIINLKLEDVDPKLDCSSKVVVSTVTKERSRNIAVVLAEDVYTKQILRCDVIIDIIDSLAIITTTKELFMEEAPEAFEVRAYDGQGNEFSTLEGVEFDWSITGYGPNRDLILVHFIPFKDSPYETPHTVEKIEQQNKRGHIVLLEGIKTGSAKVTVKLPQAEYSHIKLCEVQLSIIANLIIQPADVYVMVGDTIRFRVIHINSGRLEEVELPNFQYYLDVEDKIIASAETNSGEVTGLREGKTRVVLHDQNVELNEAGLKLPSATINVVTPVYMTLSILPHRNWAILLSEHHDIVAEVFTRNDKKIHLGEGVEIHTQVGDLFHIQQRTKNGSWLTGWAVKEGTTGIHGVIEAVMHPKLGRFKIEPEITAQAELIVFPRISLSPSELILPWDPQTNPKYELQITAEGGDGKFLWSSSNHSIGVVTQTGLVRTHFYGYFEISAAMMKNHHNRENAGIHILPPTRLEIIEYAMEAEVGSVIFLHIALYADKPNKKSMKTMEIPFTKCHNLPFKVKPSDSNFIHNKTAIVPTVGISCGNIGIVGLNVGTSKITVTYYNDGNPLEDSVTISTFKPLQLFHPKYSEIVLAVGSSAHLTFTGGPRPIVGRPSLHKRTVTSGNSSTVEAQDITDAAIKQDVIVMNILCLQLGMSVVTLAVTNNPVSPNCRNQESVATVTVICGKPRSVFLQPEIKVADVHSCPMDLSADRVVVQSYKNIELDVAVTDEQGRRFLNVSSLKFEWTISPTGLGELGTLDSIFIKNTTEGSIIHANRSYQIVKPKSQTGIIEVTVGVTGYKKDRLRRYGITSEWPEFLSEDEKEKELLPITTGIHLYLVDDTVVKPNVTSIYNHPGNTKIITVEQGSGYYEIALSDTSIANVNYLEGNREIEIIPINDGELKISLIDLCLVSQPAVIVVHVVSVSIIRIEMADKVEIGRCISCIVRLYDEDDNLLAVPDIGMIDLKSSTELDIAKVVRIKEDPKKPWPLGEIHYVVTGKELGETKVSFAIGETISAPADLQVFPPLRVFPRNATLLAGSTLQFSSTGGPQPDSNVEYSAVVKSIADVSLGGLAQGVILGHTKIHARATGINPTTGLRIIYAQDATDLEIIALTGIKISIPLSRFRVGATVPAWASPIPERLSPMILGSVHSSVRFEWDVDDPDIISINGPFTQQGIDYTPEDDLSVHVTGLKAGKTTLHLNSVVPGAITNRPDRLHVVYSTSVDIEIFEGLVVTHPKVSGETILMAPRNTLQLETNVDGINKVYYSLSSSDGFGEGTKSIQKSLTTGVPNSIVTVSETGLVQSHNKYGRAMIFVYSTDDYGLKQTVSLIVEVKPIHYMVVNVITNWRVGEPSSLNVVPLGTEFELRATYHDNTGTKFTAGCRELKLRSNRFDLIRFRPGIDNASVLISVRKPGFTLLKVWAEGYQKTVEYIKLHVNQTLSPVIDHLTTGDIICVSTPLISSSIAQQERWSSSERSLVAVDIQTGIGRVKTIRGGQVAIGHTLHPSASLQLQVVPASQIIMLPILDKILTNNPDIEVYQVPLVIVSEKYKQKTKNLLTGRHCEEELQSTAIDHPFTCHIALTNNTADIDIAQVFRVQPGFNIETGQYTCDLIPGVESNPNISTIDSNITIWAELEGGGIQASPVELHFIPCIYVERELILSEPFYSDGLHIYGLDYVLDQVIVKPIDINLLYVNPPTKDDQNLLHFEVRLLDYHWKLDELGDPMSLKVRSKLTNQFLKVHIRTQSAGEFRGPQCPVTRHSPIVSILYNYRHTLAILISMLVIFAITFYAYSRYINPVISVNIHPERSLLRAGHSPRISSTTNNMLCASHPYSSQQRSPSTTPINRNSSFTREPVYGDPSNFYSTSAELRRNRRIM